MEETYKQKKLREERERQFQRKKRLENARRVYLDFINDPSSFNLGVKYSIIDQMSEELAQYLDMVDCRRILTNMLEFVYDPSTRPEDPVDYFASLTKDRKIDKRELNKARRHLYQLMWKEYEIREEIAKLKTLLGLTCPKEYNTDGTKKTEEEKAEYEQSMDHDSSFQHDLFIRTESIKSLMLHRDEKIPPVYGSYSIPAPEPVAVLSKDLVPDGKKKRRGRSKSGVSMTSRNSARSSTKRSGSHETVKSKKSLSSLARSKTSRLGRKSSTRSKRKSKIRKGKKKSSRSKKKKKSSKGSKRKGKKKP